MLLLGNGHLVTHEKEKGFIENGAVLIDGKVIKEVADTKTLKKKYPDVEFIDAQNGLIMPGFIN
ncbi:MAG: chlorohydrolase, partial [Tetragenococcus halophilus]|nr:chlorohydrolase [Tetragenococcus halophilus]MDN6257981.1 chlorohydrolase [Tetragenococcus halophilus]MDN6723300.1 chlorohydrolase [Tetragenococcus halophilus]MDN6840593.1 chlorohydrolase [Tetragenococcus halophilus]